MVVVHKMMVQSKCDAITKQNKNHTESKEKQANKQVSKSEINAV